MFESLFGRQAGVNVSIKKFIYKVLGPLGENSVPDMVLLSVIFERVVTILDIFTHLGVSVAKEGSLSA
jgi:hypothetical protein